MKYPAKAFIVLADATGAPIVGYEIPMIRRFELNMIDRDQFSSLGLFTPYIPSFNREITMIIESWELIQHAPAETPEPGWTTRASGMIEPPRREIEP